VTLDKSNLNR